MGQWLPGAGGREDRELFGGLGVSLWEDKKVLEMVVTFAQHCECTQYR